MIVSRIVLKNWRNFSAVDVQLGERVFIVGPNASGKSNLLDAIRFLRDIARPGGGLQKAVEERGGISKIRCLATRRYSNIEVQIQLAESAGGSTLWTYDLGMRQEPRGYRRTLLTHERVWKNSNLILDRPDKIDDQDELRKTQTHLEQISTNAPFRDIAQFLESVLYLHLVPQLVRHPEAFTGPGVPGDPFGQGFLDRVARTQKRTRDARLKKIENALRVAVPQLGQLTDMKDEVGVPHLEVVYNHWRQHGAKQREDQFSDGTLRLLGLFWSLLEGDSPLLLEEPELSLHPAIVRKLASLIARMQKQRRRQVIVSTHSEHLLEDKGIGGEEVLLLTPGSEGTKVEVAASNEVVRALLLQGLSVADAAMPRTAPDIRQIELFEW